MVACPPALQLLQVFRSATGRQFIGTGTGTDTPKQVGQTTARLSHLRLTRALNPNSVYGGDAEEWSQRVHAKLPLQPG